jgi:hypothetical protein
LDFGQELRTLLVQLTDSEEEQLAVAVNGKCGSGHALSPLSKYPRHPYTAAPESGWIDTTAGERRNGWIPGEKNSPSEMPEPDKTAKEWQTGGRL